MVRAPLLLAMLGALAACGSDTATLEREARDLAAQSFGAPGQPVLIGPVSVVSDFALVDWTRGPAVGGRVLMRRLHGQWTLVLCGGAPLRRRPIVEREGRVPDIAAGLLITKLWRDESRLDPTLRAQFDRWPGRPPGAACPEARG